MAEAKEFLKRIACVNRYPLSFFAVDNGFSSVCVNHSSLKVHGDKTWRTTGFAKNRILPESKCLRMARRAGVQRMASPMGEGSQTKMFASRTWIAECCSSRLVFFWCLVSRFTLCTDPIFWPA